MLDIIYLENFDTVTVGENEGIESALRRFKRQVSKSGIFADLKDFDITKPQLKNTRNCNKEEKQKKII